MPHPSKAARKARRRKNVQANTLVRQLQNQILNQHEVMGTLLERLLKESDEKAHLAKLVTYMVATQGPATELALDGFLNFPKTAKLQEMIDEASNKIILMSVIDEDSDAPAPSKLFGPNGETLTGSPTPLLIVQDEIVAPTAEQIEIVRG